LASTDKASVRELLIIAMIFGRMGVSCAKAKDQGKPDPKERRLPALRFQYLGIINNDDFKPPSQADTA
jgi:hypothetical protein